MKNENRALDDMIAVMKVVAAELGSHEAARGWMCTHFRHLGNTPAQMINDGHTGLVWSFIALELLENEDLNIPQ